MYMGFATPPDMEQSPPLLRSPMNKLTVWLFPIPDVSEHTHAFSARTA